MYLGSKLRWNSFPDKSFHYSNTNKKLLIKQTCNYLAVLNKNQKS